MPMHALARPGVSSKLWLLAGAARAPLQTRATSALAGRAASLRQHGTQTDPTSRAARTLHPARGTTCHSLILHLPGASRGLHASAALRHGDITRPAPGTGIKVHFKDSKGQLLKTVEGNEGDDLLSLAHEYDIDLEGACEGSVACSTCHVILSPAHYDLLPEPGDDENDMLDMAFGLTDTSRLGCQVLLTRAMDGVDAMLPAATRNMFVDGHKPTHH